jgi:hypothetical protein
VLSGVDETGRKRVAFDVADDCQQVVVFLDRESSEPQVERGIDDAALAGHRTG